MKNKKGRPKRTVNIGRRQSLFFYESDYEKINKLKELQNLSLCAIMRKALNNYYNDIVSESIGKSF
jgi:hypothetical protein